MGVTLGLLVRGDVAGFDVVAFSVVEGLVVGFDAVTVNGVGCDFEDLDVVDLTIAGFVAVVFDVLV